MTIPDLLNYWLTGRAACRVHQRDDDAVRRRADADAGRPTCSTRSSCRRGCCRRSSSRARVIGALAADASPALRRHAGGRAGLPRHRRRRWRRCAAGGTRAFLSSGTWSLLGTELPRRSSRARARELNFTNEGGVCGTTRLLKNIAGLWLLQACRRTWAAQAAGPRLRRAARRRRPTSARRSRSLFDPDHPTFLHPDDMVGGDRRRTAAQTGQPEPDGPGGLHARDPREPGVQVPRRCSNRSRS